MCKDYIIIPIEQSSPQHLSEVEWISVIFYNFIKETMNNFLNIRSQADTHNTISLKRFQR